MSEARSHRQVVVDISFAGRNFRSHLYLHLYEYLIFYLSHSIGRVANCFRAVHRAVLRILADEAGPDAVTGQNRLPLNGELPYQGFLLSLHAPLSATTVLG